MLESETKKNGSGFRGLRIFNEHELLYKFSKIGTAGVYISAALNPAGSVDFHAANTFQVIAGFSLSGKSHKELYMAPTTERVL